MGEAVRNGWLFIFFWRDEVRHPIGLCNREADMWRVAILQVWFFVKFVSQSERIPKHFAGVLKWN